VKIVRDRSEYGADFEFDAPVCHPVVCAGTHLTWLSQFYVLVLFTFSREVVDDFTFHCKQVKILEKARHGMAEFDDEQLILVSQV